MHVGVTVCHLVFTSSPRVLPLRCRWLDPTVFRPNEVRVWARGRALARECTIIFSPYKCGEHLCVCCMVQYRIFNKMT